MHKKTDPDLDIDIDIEDSDTEQFGSAQFSEDTLKAYQKSEQEEDEIDNTSTPFASTSQPPNETQNDLDVESDLPDGEDLKNVKGDMRLVLESLKSRIRDLVNIQYGFRLWGVFFFNRHFSVRK